MGSAKKGNKAKYDCPPHNCQKYVTNQEWALRFLEEGEIDEVQRRVFEEARKEVHSSHSQHRLKHLIDNYESAAHDAAGLKLHRQVLLDKYTKAHYKVAEDERIVRVSAKPRNIPPNGDAMKALVENTFSGGIRPDLVEGQMMSTLRAKHLSGVGMDSAEGLPRKKLTLISNPLMAADLPYNRAQESAMPKLYATSMPRSAPMSSYKASPSRASQCSTGRASTPDREGRKFTSLSKFLTSKDGKHMNDPTLIAAISKMRQRQREMDSRVNTRR